MMCEGLTLAEYLTPRVEDLKFQKSNLRPESGSYELKPGIIRIAAEHQFSGEDDENPYKHLERLKQVCRTFHQDGVPEEWVLWNLFPFTLEDRARKWYHVASVEAGGDWKTLKVKFTTRFFSPLRVHKLRKGIWDFMQRENEDIDEAWDRLEEMRTQGPPIGFTPEMMMSIFYFSLTTKDFERLNTCAGGSLLSRKWSEAMKILSDVCLTSKAERDRKESVVQEPVGMAPTYAVFEEQQHARRTTVSYAAEEEEYESFAPQVKTECSNYRSLASAKPLTEFDKTSWMPVDFGDTLKCTGPLPLEDLKEEEELFPPEMPLRRSSDDLSTGEVLQKLFQEEELDSDFVSEVKRVIGVKPESSLTEEIIVYLEPKESSIGISCSINEEDFNNIHCSMEAQVSTMSYEVYSKLSDKPCLISTNC